MLVEFGKASSILNPPNMVQNSVLLRGPTTGKMNWKSSASKSGFFDPNATASERSVFVLAMSSSGP